MDIPETRQESLGTEGILDEGTVFGVSKAMAQIKKKAERIAPTDIPILIRGESGTGKEVIAKYLHMHSLVSDGPFVKVNCAAIPGPLLESELFGYEKGAFTGAAETKLGRVESANDGTLFLDEIGDMAPDLQTKLLHLLQDGTFSRIGGRETLRSRLRILCATNCDLETAIEKGTFRQDLFYRIDVVSLHLPPLRERREDIELLVDFLFAKLSRKFQRDVPPPSKSVLALLQKWNWPGNIRELENWVARYIILGSEQVMNSETRQRIVPEEAPEPSRSAAGPVQLKVLAREAALAAERTLILRSLEANQWNRRKAARELHISYRALLYKIRDAGLSDR
jgi:two-component system, NtrC family, response regulator AtoC